jgi:hypothetical protein
MTGPTADWCTPATSLCRAMKCEGSRVERGLRRGRKRSTRAGTDGPLEGTRGPREPYLPGGSGRVGDPGDYQQV